MKDRGQHENNFLFPECVELFRRLEKMHGDFGLDDVDKAFAATIGRLRKLRMIKLVPKRPTARFKFIKTPSR